MVSNLTRTLLFVSHHEKIIETGQIFSVGAGQVFDVEAGQTTAVETRQTSLAETR